MGSPNFVRRIHFYPPWGRPYPQSGGILPISIITDCVCPKLITSPSVFVTACQPQLFTSECDVKCKKSNFFSHSPKLCRNCLSYPHNAIFQWISVYLCHRIYSYMFWIEIEWKILHVIFNSLHVDACTLFKNITQLDGATGICLRYFVSLNACFFLFSLLESQFSGTQLFFHYRNK